MALSALPSAARGEGQQVIGRVKRDANHGDVVRALEAVGCTVVDLSMVGGGCPDLLVYRRSTGLLRLLEIKTEKGRLSLGQLAFARLIPVWVVRSPMEALEALEVTK
jgi:hypothetical protein